MTRFIKELKDCFMHELKHDGDCCEDLLEYAHNVNEAMHEYFYEEEGELDKDGARKEILENCIKVAKICSQIHFKFSLNIRDRIASGYYNDEEADLKDMLTDKIKHSKFISDVNYEDYGGTIISLKELQDNCEIVFLYLYRLKGAESPTLLDLYDELIRLRDLKGD